MFPALLEKLVEADFEDIFQPYDAKEVEKRWPEWNIMFISRNLAPNEEELIKSVHVKAPAHSQDFAIRRAIKSLGIPLNRLDGNNVSMYKIEFKSIDNIKDDHFRLMVGNFTVVWSMYGDL